MGLCSDNQSWLVLSDGRYLCRHRAASTKRLLASLRFPDTDTNDYKWCFHFEKTERRAVISVERYTCALHNIIKLTAKLWKNHVPEIRWTQCASVVAYDPCQNCDWNYVSYFLFEIKQNNLSCLPSVWWPCTTAQAKKGTVAYFQPCKWRGSTNGTVALSIHRPVSRLVTPRLGSRLKYQNICWSTCLFMMDIKHNDIFGKCKSH